MSQKTSIEWTHHTFNPWWGCIKVSPGCEHCYADTLAKRYGHDVWGPAKTTGRRTFTAKHWNDPLKWNREAEAAGERRRVFCGSMCDWAEDHPTANAEREKLWPLIRATEWLDWLLLTKRPERIPDCLPDDWGEGYANVWLGTSVEDQQRANRAAILTTIPARVRFVSAEPLLGPVNLRAIRVNGDEDKLPVRRVNYPVEVDALGGESVSNLNFGYDVPRIDWVIIGGESGPGARPFDVAWAYALIAQCKDAGTAPFVKQLGKHILTHGATVCQGGSWPDGTRLHVGNSFSEPLRAQLADAKGGDWMEWPEDLRIREYPIPAQRDV